MPARSSADRREAVASRRRETSAEAQIEARNSKLRLRISATIRDRRPPLFSVTYVHF
jgi:hypothetical protein